MIKVKVDFNFGDPAYLKADPGQTEYTFVGVVARSGHIKYELDISGSVFEVYDFQVSKEKDLLKAMGINQDAEQQEETDENE